VANAVSPWLVTPFLVGAFTRRTVLAAFVGLLTCAAHVAGYYLVADLRGFVVGSAPGCRSCCSPAAAAAGRP
jgi:hypothetical protein